MATIGSAYIEIGAKTSQFDAAMKGVNKQLEGLTKISQKFKDVGKSLSIGITAPVAALGATFIKAASDLQETQSKFDAVFGEMSKTTRDWASEQARTLGRGQGDIEKYLSSVQDLLVPMGVAAGEAQEMSKQISLLTVDLASFNNKAESDVIRDLQSALTGSSETMKKYGVIVNEAAVNQELLNMGIAGGSKEANNAQKAQARLNIIMRGTTAAQGDAIRTAGSFANQMKNLRARFGDLAENFGKILLPIATKIVSILAKVSDTIANLSPETQKLILIIGGFAAAIGPLLFTLGSLGSLIPTITGGLSILAGVFAGLSAPILPIVAAVGALIAAGVLLYKNWDEVVKFAKANFLPIFDEIKKNFNTLIEIAKELYNQVKPIVMAIFDLFVSFAAYIGGQFLSGLSSAFKFIGDIIKSFGFLYTAFLNGLQGNTSEALKNVANFFLNTWNAIVDFVERAISSLAGTLADFLGSIGLDSVSAGLRKVGEDIANSSLFNVTLFDTAKQKIDAVTASVQTLKEVTAPGQDGGGGLGGGGATGGGGLAGISSLEPSNIESINLGLGLVTQNTQTAAAAAQSAFTTIGNSVVDVTEKTVTMTQALTNAAVGQFNLNKAIADSALAFGQQALQFGQNSKGLKDYSKQLLRSVKANVSALIAEGVAASVRNALTKVPFPFNIAAAGIAGGAAAALFNSIIPSFADGGIVSGETIARVGEYAGAKSNPEVIAPLDKLNSIIGDTGGLSADDLNNAFSKQKITVNSRIGMTEIVRESGRTQYVARKGTFNV